MTALRVLLGTVLLTASGFPAEPGFEAFYNLEYDRAVELFEAEVKRAPNDPLAHNHLAHALLYRALFQADALDTAAALAPSRFLSAKKPNVPDAEKRRFLEVIQASLRASQDDQSATGRYAAGVAHIHRASFHLFVNKAWRACLRDATRARELHQQALKLAPQMIDARLIPATHDYAVGSLPWWAKAIGFLAGFRGDKAGGIASVEVVAKEGIQTKVEAQVLMAMIHRREGRPAKAAEVMAGLCQLYPRNFLFRMERIHALLATANRAAARADLDILIQYPNLKADRLEKFRRSTGL